MGDAKHRFYGVALPLALAAAGVRGLSTDRRPGKRPKSLPVSLARVLHHLAPCMAPANESPASARQPCPILSFSPFFSAQGARGKM